MVYVPSVNTGVVAPTVMRETSYPTRVVAGHTLVDLPGGWYVQGSAKCRDTSPRWVKLTPFAAAVSPVSEAHLRSVVGTNGTRGGNPASTPEMPATRVSWDQAVAYCVAVNEVQGTSLRLLTDAEGEYAGRGPAVDLRAVMQAEGVSLNDFACFVEERYENFVTVFDPGARIFTDVNDTELRRLLQTDVPLYAWCMYAPHGRLDKTTAWYDRDELPSAEWGPANGFGLKLGTGGVWEWRADTRVPGRYPSSAIEDPITLTQDRAPRSVRGGSCYVSDRVNLRLAFRNYYRPAYQYEVVGFRVGAPQDSPA